LAADLRREGLVGPVFHDARDVPEVGRPAASLRGRQRLESRGSVLSRPAIGYHGLLGTNARSVITRSPSMPDLSTRGAVERITRAVEAMGPDDLLDFHN